MPIIPGANILEPRSADCPVAISTIISSHLGFRSSNDLSIDEITMQSLKCVCTLTEGFLSLFLRRVN